MLFATKDIPYQNIQENQDSEQRKTKIRRIRNVDDSNLLDVVDSLEDDDLIEYVSKGRFSLHNIIEHLISLTGPATVIIATWAMSRKPLSCLYKLKSQGKITELYCLLEHKVPGHNQKSFVYAQSFFDAIWLARCHAKVVIIENENFSVVVTTSSNLTRNKRIEAGDIKVSRASVAFNKSWIIKEAKDGVHRFN
jgi:hypothetical protein